jgi:hypothetical protein
MLKSIINHVLGSHLESIKKFINKFSKSPAISFTLNEISNAAITDKTSIVKSPIDDFPQFFSEISKVQHATKNANDECLQSIAKNEIKILGNKQVIDPEVKEEPEPASSKSFSPKLINLKPENLDELTPGFLADTNILMHLEDYPEFLANGQKFSQKIGFQKIYVLSKSREEFLGKKQPKDYLEKVVDNGYTGKKRDFQALLESLPHALGRDVYYVDISTNAQVARKANDLMSKWGELGLHDADSYFLSFGKITDSRLVTCDKTLIRCCKLSQCNCLEFLEFAEIVMQPSPITEMMRDRKIMRRSHILENKNNGKIVPIHHNFSLEFIHAFKNMGVTS